MSWLQASERRSGGSSAYSVLGVHWYKAYPETTGYIVPTLNALSERLGSPEAASLAARFGEWLLNLQESPGCWRGGTYPYARKAEPSVFNTGQILFALNDMARRDPAGPWGAAGERAAVWLADGVDENGAWSAGHYRGHQPAYYAHVAWPMAEYAQLTDNQKVGAAVERVLAAISERRQANGAIEGWGFDAGKPAFTHTIAYTLQGLQECARIRNESKWAEITIPVLERLRRSAEFNDGRLPGRFDNALKADKRFECMTGSSQIAACFLLAFDHDGDPRWINAAAKLVDRVCAIQSSGPGQNRGGVPGSAPLRGPYLRFRYPNWAVKFHVDSILRLENALGVLRDR